MNPLLKLTAGCLVSLVALVAALPTSPGGQQTELVLYCAANARSPIEELTRQYELATGVAIHVQYGGSNSLLTQIEVSRRGDLFLAADASYVTLARDKELALQVTPLARISAVVGVAAGNPFNVKSLGDLLELRLSMGNPQQAAIGKVTQSALEASGHWRAIDQAVRTRGVYKPTVNDVANDVLLGSADAGVLWDAVAHRYPDIEIIQLPELAGASSELTLAVLKSSEQPTAARRFADYLASPAGQVVFRENGYAPLEKADE